MTDYTARQLSSEGDFTPDDQKEVQGTSLSDVAALPHALKKPANEPVNSAADEDKAVSRQDTAAAAVDPADATSGGTASAAAASAGAAPVPDKEAAQDSALKADNGGTDDNKKVRKRFLHLSFGRSLKFRVFVIVAVVCLITNACMGYLSYYKSVRDTNEFVDEELSQISMVAINYKMTIPRRWEAPRHNHERVLRLRSSNGEFVLEYGRRSTPDEADTSPRQGQGMGRGHMGMGPGYGMGMGRNGAGASAGAGAGAGAGAAGAHQRAPEPWLPSIYDIANEFEIVIAPLYGRPGDALYIPPGVSDGFYTILVADQRVRAFIATNTAGQRFVVARPLSSVDVINNQALITALWQFAGITLVMLPILMISVKLMFDALNKIARSLYQRSEDDLSPVVPENHTGYVPSELDSFILALNRLFSKVDEGIQSKRRFIADAAHEMRTPLTALSLQAESLAKEDLSASARRKVERLQEGISRERELMTSLLTLAREQNRSDLMLENIDIMELFVKLIDEQGVLADRKNIDLGVEGKANYKIVCDRMRLTRVMSNLLSNAIKYTPEFGRIDLMAIPFADGRLRLVVQDDGPGIPDEFLSHIMEPFYRVHGDRSQVQGTGLGLAIVKASCDSIKADLNFANANPHGLIASVTLRPLSPASKDEAQSVPMPQTKS